ncbi:MAG: helix-turn-helix transcriptional regulator [Desulfobacterales bacterium]|nr:MAG: helix-turn-helix transcriptional regulator [Desulfobacterales bacterium]
MSKNSLKKIRESILMSKAELARKANVSPITISRIEQGLPLLPQDHWHISYS